MKKLITISTIAAFMAITTGTFAADPSLVLTFPDENQANNAVSSYENEWTATAGGFSWTIANFNNNKWNNWTYIKCGRNGKVSTASVTTASAVAEAIETIVVTFDKYNADKVNSCKMLVASDAGFGTVSETIAPEISAAGDITFTVGTPAANLFYKLEIDCMEGSSNGFVQISKIACYKQGDAPVLVDISNTPETAYTVSRACELVDAGEGLATKVYVKGFITNIGEVDTGDYGNATYYISDVASDATNTLYIFRGYYLENTKFTSADQIKVGDEVVVYGQLMLYGETKEIGSGNYIYSLNGGTALAIKDITADKIDTDAPVYDLMGRRVSKQTKGILIQNGKKFFVR